MTDPNKITFYDPTQHQPPNPKQEAADALIEHLGKTRFFSTGIDLWQEVCKKRKLHDKAKKAKVGWDSDEQQLIFIPTASEDETGLVISYTSRQRSAAMRLRSVFLHYKIEMLKDSKWYLKGQIRDLPALGYALVFDLDEKVLDVQRKKKETAAASAGK